MTEAQPEDPYEMDFICDKCRKPVYTNFGIGGASYCMPCAAEEHAHLIDRICDNYFHGTPL